MEQIFDIDSFETFSQVSEEILSNLYSSEPLATAINFDPEIIITAKDEIRKLLVQNSFDITKVATILLAQDWDEQKVEMFISLMETKKTDILYNTLVNIDSEHGETIVDFDWGIKYVSGTNHSKTLKYPLLQLMLDTDDSTIGDREKRAFDIKKEVLSQLIDILYGVAT